ncbi:MAG: 6-phosphogluconolactonase [Candidatus Omnitrophica bacterium]|nr:6-phosphogluconolactonase [Candidatus Omnitrophota bacterium]MBU4590730.1 6-phosphogluconolactonase [Candidatus Omnitrophota bacterium]
MLKFRKGFSIKVISILVALGFFLNSTVYAIDLRNKTHLRVPSSFQNQEHRKRVQGVLFDQIGISTKLPSSTIDVLIEQGGNIIRDFLEKLTPYVENPEGSPYFDIAKVKWLWDVVRRYRDNPVAFSDEALVNEKEEMVRIVVRGRDKTTEEADQVIIAGIPLQYRETYIETLNTLLRGQNVSIRTTGFRSVEINVKGVDKSLPIDYIDRHFDEILGQMGYAPGPYIDVRKTRTVVFADADGTTYGKPTVTTKPVLYESAAYGDLIDYLEAGGIYCVITSNGSEFTRERLMEREGIHRHLRNRVIVAANGSAVLNILNSEGRFVEVVDYSQKALYKVEGGREMTLDAVYIADETSPYSSDFSGYKEVGFSRVVCVSSEPMGDILQELHENYIGGMENGTGYVLRAVVEQAKVQPEETLFTEDKLRSIIKRARELQTLKEIVKLVFSDADQLPISSLLPDILSDPVNSYLKLKQSYSGIRGLFGAKREISKEAEVIALVYGYVYASYMIERWQEATPDKDTFTFVVGRDPRSTGAILNQLFITSLLMAAEEKGVEIQIKDIGVATSPIAESAVRSFNADGGVIITASHADLEFNGWKLLTGKEEPGGDFLNQNGAILTGYKIGEVIKRANELLVEISAGSSDFVEKAAKFLSPEHRDTVRRVSLPTLVEQNHEEAINEYIRSLERMGFSVRELEIVNDPNGGAACGIANRVLTHFGAQVIEINKEQGECYHKIEPIGEAMDDLKKAVEETGAKVGVAFDWDADRGNLVVRDAQGKVYELSPQNVAYLNVACMIAWTKTHIDRYPEAERCEKWAVVVHGATSLRVWELCSQLGIEVFEVETGEVNVVSKMHELEAEGYFVPIGIEGYSGGTVFRGTEIRDGTLTALLALSVLSDIDTLGYFKEHFDLKVRKDVNDYVLSDILECLPEYHTHQTDLEAEGVQLTQRQIKSNLEEVFERKIIAVSQGKFTVEGLNGIEFVSYEFLNYEETNMFKGKGNREKQTGGFKILLTDTQGKRHFMWFRGSKTEAGVFRVCVDSPDEDISEALKGLQEELYQSAIVEESISSPLEAEGDVLTTTEQGRLVNIVRVNTVITENKEAAEWRAARKIADLIKSKNERGEKVVIGFATGGTYEGIYAKLIEITKAEGISWANAVTFNLDEYVWQAYGYPEEYRSKYYEKESYRNFMYNNLFTWMIENAGLRDENTHLMDGFTNNPELEARLYEEAIMRETNGEGVDLQVLGIGVEGHIAFIEARPGMPLEDFLQIKTRDEELAPSTIEANSRNFDNNTGAVPTHAMTQGISTILKAKEVLLVGAGSKKVEAITNTVAESVAPVIPASVLQLHQNAIVIIDKDAAQGLIEVAKNSRKQQVDSRVQIIAVPAYEIIGNEDAFMNWVSKQPENFAIVIIARSRKEYDGLVERFDNIAWIKIVDAPEVDLDGIEPERILKGVTLEDIDTAFVIFGDEEFFNSFNLGRLDIDRDRAIVEAVGSGV